MSSPSSPKLSPNPKLKNIIIEETEKQVWEIIRSIPGLNVTYGSVRCLVYGIKKNEKESKDSAVGAAKGALQTGAIAAGLFAAPVTIPVVSGVLTGIAAKSISDSLEVLVFFVTNIDQLHSQPNSDEKEKFFFDNIKNATGVGAFYSAIRIPIYLFKRNKQRSIESGVSFLENSGEIAAQVGIRMIPNMDDQLQKVLEKTTKYAIKFFAKKVMEQVTLQKLPLEEGLQEISNVENDLQTIMNIANDSDSEVVPEMDNVSKLTVDNDNVEGMNTTDQNSQMWSLFVPRCFRKSPNSLSGKEGESSPVSKVEMPHSNSDQSPFRPGLSNDVGYNYNNVPNSHVLVLTE